MSSIRRTIQVLDLLARKGALGARGVAQQLNLPVGSVHRLLIELEAEKVVERNAEGSWQLAYRLLEIVDLQLDGVEIPRLARPFCENMAEVTRETVNLNLLTGGACVCIDKVRGSDGMQLDLRIGSRAPLYCGGSAKAMLAFLPEAERERIIAEPRERFTAFTLMEPDALRGELDDIRTRGYAIDNQEMVIGVFCVGVPIVDRTGRPVAAISITGSSQKTPGPGVAPWVAMLQDACMEVSRRLGYGGTWPPQHVETGKARSAG